jgi:dihydroneopterin aldolase
MDEQKIFIHGWETETVVGIHPAERIAPQPVRLDIDVWGDFSEAANSDDISRALDYQKLQGDLESILESHKCTLVESLAKTLAYRVLSYPLARKVKIRLAKTTILPDVAAVGVEITRSKS